MMTQVMIEKYVYEGMEETQNDNIFQPLCQYLHLISEKSLYCLSILRLIPWS